MARFFPILDLSVFHLISLDTKDRSGFSPHFSFLSWKRKEEGKEVDCFFSHPLVESEEVTCHNKKMEKVYSDGERNKSSFSYYIPSS